MISVVITTFNRAALLDRAINSVLNQSYDDWELVIVDNSSSDNTDQIVKKYTSNKIKMIKVNNNGIIALSRNSGIKQTKGEYIAFLDDDDFWHPKKLEEVSKYIVEGSDVIYHDMFIMSKENQKIFFKKLKTRQVKKPVFWDLLRNGNPIAHSSVVIKRNLFNDIDGVNEDPDLVGSEDFNTWLQIGLNSDKFTFINQALGYLWTGIGNYTNADSNIRNIEVIKNIYQKEIDQISEDEDFWWMDYTQARAHYLKRNYHIAEKKLKELMKKKTDYIIKLKALWMLFHISINEG